MLAVFELGAYIWPEATTLARADADVSIIADAPCTSF